MDQFWEVIEKQLAELKTAQSAGDVLRILSNERDPYYAVQGQTECHGPIDNGGRHGFFAGSGGDETVWGALSEAGWRTVWIEADYYWCMRAPNGDLISYVEGDIYRGDSQERKS